MKAISLALTLFEQVAARPLVSKRVKQFQYYSDVPVKLLRITSYTYILILNDKTIGIIKLLENLLEINIYIHYLKNVGYQNRIMENSKDLKVNSFR